MALMATVLAVVSIAKKDPVAAHAAAPAIRFTFQLDHIAGKWIVSH
jgi:hypothetical protein